MRVHGHGHSEMEVSKLQKAEPRTREELQCFAYDLGEHCQGFDNHVFYKSFVEYLIKDLAADFKQNELLEVLKHVQSLASKRAREERSGNVTHVLGARKEEEEQEGEVVDDFNSEDDFM